MKVSDRNIDLNEFFPFSRCDAQFRTKAQAIGKCVHYTTGETVLLSGSPAKHCGLIVDGQAVAFKLDNTGRRYQLCLEEGCFIGLEMLQPDNQYTAKIVALTDLDVFFWNADGMGKLTEADPVFADAMEILNNGRIYQEQWLIPETDITDPVLCSLHSHWLSIIFPALWIIPLLLISLSGCAMLIRHYPAAWLLVFALLGAAGVLLYRQLTARFNERFIATSKNLILVPGNDNTDMIVTRLGNIQSLSVQQNIFEKLINAGRVSFVTEERRHTSQMLCSPVLAAMLIRNFSERAADGRPIPLRIGKDILSHIPSADKESGISGAVSPEETETSSLPQFKTIVFRPHWALLAKKLFQPLLIFSVAFYAIHYFRYSEYADSIRKALLIIAAAAVFAMIYQVLTWRNHRFIIEEDCIKDYSKKPFSNEDLNMAMNHKIESVRYEKKGFFQNLLNYGTVYILAGEGELSFDYVSDPQRIQQLIMNTCSRYEDKRRMEEEARRRAYISDLVREIQNENAGF